jgi:hypothetical protein
LRGDFDLARATTLLRETIRTAEEQSTNPTVKPLWRKMIDVFKNPDVVESVVDMSLIAAQALQALPPGQGN